MERMKESKEIIMSRNNWRDLNTATKCFICDTDLQQGDRKVGDHCHFTGRYRGCAHHDCNLQFAMRYHKIPVFLHTLKNYDNSNLIMEMANELSERGNIDVIAQNSEKNITFAFKNLCFKDSFSFLSSSLDKVS
jgi:hypothetical protein